MMIIPPTPLSAGVQFPGSGAFLVDLRLVPVRKPDGAGRTILHTGRIPLAKVAAQRFFLYAVKAGPVERADGNTAPATDAKFPVRDDQACRLLTLDSIDRTDQGTERLFAVLTEHGQRPGFSFPEQDVYP
jgi:hypothetical protein